MCSVSFLPRDDGFALAMNRDELRSRASALPPERLWRGKLSVLCPRESGGGTWIGVNSAGMAFSLINWHSQPDCECRDPVSRGEVVRALLSAPDCKAAALFLKELPLGRMNPFRLIMVSLPQTALSEVRSHSGALEFHSLPWRRHHWFSSGLDEAEASRVRRRTCARIPGDSLDLPVLRKLHRSHAPKKGAFSLCMHRDDARTVSYTEINASGSMASMYYIAGPPCSQSPRFQESLGLDVATVLGKIA
jgi:hypothetical protein